MTIIMTSSFCFISNNNFIKKAAPYEGTALYRLQQSRQYPSGFIANDNNAEYVYYYDVVCFHKFLIHYECINNNSTTKEIN